MRTLVRRTTATIVSIALLLFGSYGFEERGWRLWLTYGAIAAGMYLAYYALTGRTFLPERERPE